MGTSSFLPLIDALASVADGISPAGPSLRIGDLEAVRGGALVGVILRNMYEGVPDIVPHEVRR